MDATHAAVVLAGFGRSPEPSIALAECILAKHVMTEWQFMKVLHVTGKMRLPGVVQMQVVMK
ncbi:hypothetical protein M8494_38075 [Serratia ureilytica]